MNAIKMKRLELLEIVKANKIKHIEAYNEAVTDYAVLVLQISTTNLKLAKTGLGTEFDKIKNRPTSPVTYETNYARAIRMLELSVEDIIDVEEDIFNQLVLDEWSWKHNFTATAAMYKSSI